MTTVSTHVLDTEPGEPAAGMRVELCRGRELVGAGRDRRRRADRASSPTTEPGKYRLVFHPPRLLPKVELEIELGDGHYHVPLLVSPYACATYRGS